MEEGGIMFDSKINGILLVLILMAAGVNLRAKTFRIGGSLSYATKNDNVKGSPSYGAFLIIK